MDKDEFKEKEQELSLRGKAADVARTEMETERAKKALREESLFDKAAGAAGDAVKGLSKFVSSRRVDQEKLQNMHSLGYGDELRDLSDPRQSGRRR